MVINVALEVIDDNPYNPRKHYPQAKVKEMAQSLVELGLRQVPEGRQVDGRVQLAYGHMRLRAFIYNRRRNQPGDWSSMPVDVKEISDQDMFHYAMEENLRRTDITPIEVARCIQAYSEMFPDVLDEDIGKKHSMSAQNVSNMKRVLRLPQKFLDKIDEGTISFSQGRELLTMEGLPNDENLMTEAINGLKIGNKQWGEPNTLDGLQKSIHSVIRNHFPPLEKEFAGYRYDLLFDTRAAGCLECRKMVRTHPTKSQAAHFCSDEQCWQAKQTEHREQAAAAAKAKMQAEVISRAAQVIAQEEKAPPAAPEPAVPINTYRIQNLVSKEWWEGEAVSPEAACQAAGWEKENCWVRVKTEKGGWGKADFSHEKSAQWRCGQCNQYFEFFPPPEGSTALVECPACQYGYVTYRRADGVVFCYPQHNYTELPKVTIPSTLLGAAVEEELETRADERDRQMEEARERANLERPAGEVPCDTCAKGQTCNRSFFHIADDDSGRLVCEQWECDHVSWATPPVATAEIPEDILALAKEKAGTRAEVLDLKDICAGERYWRQVEQGYAILDDELRHVDDPAECLERCTRGFHYAFDSKAADQKVIHVCSDTKCLAKKKAALTRKRNAAGLALKNAERKAIQDAVDAADLHPTGVLKLILYAQAHGSHISKYSYGDGTKSPEKWLWDKVSAGTRDIDRNTDLLMKKLDKLEETELRGLLVEMMFYYLVDHGDVGTWEIKTEIPLSLLGVDIKNYLPAEGQGEDTDHA